VHPKYIVSPCDLTLKNDTVGFLKEDVKKPSFGQQDHSAEAGIQSCKNLLDSSLRGGKCLGVFGIIKNEDGNAISFPTILG
jgi:hypothetical protein